MENWRIFRRLIGHDNDVQDLGWSHDSSILVSVGLDSKVVVWSGHTFEKLKTISSHQSHVKGLTFDPANKHFATASDDRTIKIFRFVPPGPNSTAHDSANNFILEKTITAPFSASPLTTYFRRCSWSPDGLHIAAANATNGPVNSVAIINRGQWDGDIHLIGHEGPVEVCAFSPRLFSKLPIANGTNGQNGQPAAFFVTVIACGGQDKSLSIWITCNSRPVLVAHDIALKPISDLAWSPDGRNLFLTSLDGSIIAACFQEEDLGFSVSMEENEKALAKYGGGRRGAGMVEGPEALFLEEQSREGELRGVEGRMGALMGDEGGPGPAPVVANGTSSIPQTNGTPAPVDVSTPDLQSYRATTATEPVKAPEAEDTNAAKLQRMKSRVTITKDGKKRIAPLLVSSSGAAESSLPRSQLMAANVNGQGINNDAPQTILDLSKPFDGLPKGGLAALLFGNKRSAAVDEVDAQARRRQRLAIAAARDGGVPIISTAAGGTVQAVANEEIPLVPEFIRPAVTNPSLLVSQLRLAVPKVRSTLIRNLTGNLLGKEASNQVNGSSALVTTSAPTDTVFEVRNPTGPSPIGRSEAPEPARVLVTKNGQPLWLDFLPKSALLVTGNETFWTVACEDGSIYCWSPAGKRLLNPLVIESQPVILDCRDSMLLCVTAAGMCYIWDIKKLSSPHPPISLAPILDIAVHTLQVHPTKAPAITSVRLNSEGRIIVTLTNGDGYAYSPSMLVWQRLSEVWWSVGSQYWNTTDVSVGNLSNASRPSEELSATKVSAGVIPYLERNTTSETLARGRAGFLNRLVKTLLPREGYETFESNVSIAHLENRLAAAMMLGAKEEFRTYLFMYAKRLGAEGLRMKIEELLHSLLEGSFPDEEGHSPPEDFQDRTWVNPTDKLCGWKKEELLREVILILGKLLDALAYIFLLNHLICRETP